MSETDDVLDPRIACEVMLQEFGAEALKLTADQHLREDLVNEMALAVLETEGSHTKSYFRQRALWRAKDYLRKNGDRARPVPREA